MARIIRNEDWVKRVDVATLADEPCAAWMDLPSRGIISAEMLEAVDRAKKVLASAENEAERVRLQAQKLLVKAQEEYEKEKERGYEEGLEEGKAEFVEKITEAKKDHEEMLKNAESEIVGLVSEIAEKVLGREVEEGAIVSIVKHSLSKLQGQQIIVRVHPEDVTHLKERQAELFEVLGDSRTLSIREDETIEKGGCAVETELGVLDAQLSTQLNGIKRALGLLP